MNDKPPTQYLSGVVVTDRVAYLLERHVDFKPLRAKIRGDDRELDQVLLALRWAAVKWATSVHGSAPRKTTEAGEESEPRALSPRQVADRLGITEHAVRLAIREDRLPATKTDGRWHIDPADLANYRQQHAA